ncbi:MAG: Scr1 family TA system antitoxin-like transcriptional regulator [Nocardioidaceae bacterium]
MSRAPRRRSETCPGEPYWKPHLHSRARERSTAPLTDATGGPHCSGTWPGSPSVMRGQIRHIVARAELATVSVRVLPMGGADAVALSPFLIYDFRAERTPRTVLIETMTTDVYLSAAEDVAGYVELFDRLSAEALEPAESINYLARLAQRVPHALGQSSPNTASLREDHLCTEPSPIPEPPTDRPGTVQLNRSRPGDRYEHP